LGYVHIYIHRQGYVPPDLVALGLGFRPLASIRRKWVSVIIIPGGPAGSWLGALCFCPLRWGVYYADLRCFLYLYSAIKLSLTLFLVRCLSTAHFAMSGVLTHVCSCTGLCILHTVLALFHAYFNAHHNACFVQTIPEHW
jgi:hypothetical protein